MALYRANGLPNLPMCVDRPCNGVMCAEMAEVEKKLRRFEVSDEVPEERRYGPQKRRSPGIYRASQLTQNKGNAAMNFTEPQYSRASIEQEPGSYLDRDKVGGVIAEATGGLTRYRVAGHGIPIGIGCFWKVKYTT